MNAEQLRNSIFSLRTRRLDIIGHIILKRLGVTDNKNFEVRLSTVQRKATKLYQENILDGLEQSLIENRIVNFNNYKDYDFDCNIQQLKLHEFDTLYYGLFFADCLQIFSISAEEIKTRSFVNYSNFQHKGNENEGQFHITNGNLSNHVNNFLKKTLTYSELLVILTQGI